MSVSPDWLSIHRRIFISNARLGQAEATQGLPGSHFAGWIGQVLTMLSVGLVLALCSFTIRWFSRTDGRVDETEPNPNCAGDQTKPLAICNAYDGGIGFILGLTNQSHW
jgi:hypothetical protein